MSFWRYYIPFETIVIRETQRYTRIWIQTIVPPAITMTLYFVIFGSLIGRRIGEMGGVPFVDYIAPGIIMMAVITNAYSNVVSSFFGAKFQRHIEEILVAPVPSWVIILGYVAGGVGRGLLVGLVVTIVASFFVSFQIHNLAVVISVVALTSVLFALGGLINAIFAKKFDDISIVPTFILTPLTYLGGVFYTISMLPEFWQKVSLANPILYMVNAFRYGFLGQSDVPLAVSYALIFGFIVVLFCFCLWLINRGTGIRT